MVWPETFSCWSRHFIWTKTADEILDIVEIKSSISQRRWPAPQRHVVLALAFEKKVFFKHRTGLRGLDEKINWYSVVRSDASSRANIPAELMLTQQRYDLIFPAHNLYASRQPNFLGAIRNALKQLKLNRQILLGILTKIVDQFDALG